MVSYCSEAEFNRYSDTVADKKQVKAKTIEKWYFPLVSTTDTKRKTKEEFRAHGWENRQGEWEH